MGKPCIIPVSAAFALQWVEGRLLDRDLFLNAPLVPEAVFIADLPDLRAYAVLLRTVAYWKERGAVVMITRTATPVIVKHLVAFGAVPGLVESELGPPVKTRYLLPPAGFAAWVSKWHKTTR